MMMMMMMMMMMFSSNSQRLRSVGDNDLRSNAFATMQ